MKTSVCLTAMIAVVVIQMVNAQDKTTATPVTGTTKTCKDVMCTDGCERVMGRDGCPICDCQANCRAVTCLVGYESEKAVISCFQASGSESNATCVPIANRTHCPTLQCGDEGPGCVANIGPNGCPICECPVTCKNISCTKDEECILEARECKRDPCFLRPTCAPRYLSCTGTPNTSICSDFNDTQYCWSFNARTQSCQRFRYYGCTPSPNTWTSLKACEDKCKSSNVCEVCLKNCYTFRKKDEPTKCICPNPCKDFNCTTGEVCRLIEPVCVNATCNSPPEPFCLKNPCPEPEPCDLRCWKSFKMDDNGCQLCECCDQYAGVVVW